MVNVCVCEPKRVHKVLNMANPNVDDVVFSK